MLEALSVVMIIIVLALGAVVVGYRVLLEEWPWQMEARRRERMRRIRP